ncbi:hypothetical protein JCM11641_005518 [Rhodosporidiobolus odoratus]
MHTPTLVGAGTNLLSLPVEVLQHIVLFVGLLRYDDSESRRPKPSALHHLAYGTNRLLRSLALPHIGRLASTRDAPQELLLQQGQSMDSRGLVRVLRHHDLPEDEMDLVPFARLGHLYPNMRQLVLSFPASSIATQQTVLRCPGVTETPSPNKVTSLVIRRGRAGEVDMFMHLFTHAAASFPNLTHVEYLHCRRMRLWLRIVASTPTVRSLVVTPRWTIDCPPLQTWECGDMWSKLTNFAFTSPPPTPLDAHTSQIIPALVGFALAPTAPLRSLSLATQLATHLNTNSYQLSDLVTAIISSFGAVPLISFGLDVHATCGPADLHKLASAFPKLRKLSLGDRLIWQGSRSDLLGSLLPLDSLEVLSCRVLPDTPPSTYDPPSDSSEPLDAQSLGRAAASPYPDNDLDTDLAEFASPAQIALEAALVMPRLSRVGFTGRQSTMEWFRISREEDGRPVRAEGFELYCLYLDRP